MTFDEDEKDYLELTLYKAVHELMEEHIKEYHKNGKGNGTTKKFWAGLITLMSTLTVLLTAVTTYILSRVS